MNRILPMAGAFCLFIGPVLQAPPARAEQPPVLAETGITYGKWRSSIMGGGGYIQNVVPCPTNQKRFYTYVDVGGLSRSDDGGYTWEMLHGRLPASPGNYEVRGLLVDPRDDNKLIAATGSQYARKEGIYISNDAGNTWTKTLDAQFYGNGGSRSTGFILARHPQNPDIVVAASATDGVWKSTDNGRTWQESGGKDLYPCDIRFDRATPERLWMCAGKGKVGKKEFTAGFYRSEDGGATWTKLSDETPSEILQDPVDPSSIYGIFRSEIIKRSRDAGNTWEDFSDGLDIQIEEKPKGSISSSAYRALAAGPDFILTATTSNSIFFKLKSGESKWERIQKERVDVGEWYGPAKGGWFFGAALGSITVDPHEPNHWFLTDFFAIYQSHDAGKTWEVTINGIEVTVSHCLLQDPSDPGIVHLGQADVGPFTSTDGGKRFRKDKVPDDKDAPAGGKNMKCIDLSPKLPNRLYGVADKSYYVGWMANQVYVSLDRGETWRRSPMLGLPDMSKRTCTTITADLNDPYTVYLTVAGKIEGEKGGGVYKSMDGGATWSYMGHGLPQDQFYFPYEIWAHGRQLAAGADGSLIAISTISNFVHRYDPDTKTWENVDLKKAGKVWSVVADRLTPGRYFVGVRDDGIYRTDDSGKTWKKVFHKSASFVVTDAAVSGRVAAGAGTGVILSRDSGESWEELDQNLPYRVHNIPCFVGERLVAGSAGSGVFWLPISPEGEQAVAARPMIEAAITAGRGGKLPNLKNLDFNAEGELLPGWSVWNQGGVPGKLKLTRETKTVRSKPAAFSLANEGGEAAGSASQEFEPAPGLFTISGFARLQGTPKESLIAIQVFDANKQQIAWINLLKVSAKEKSWQSFKQTIGLPPNTAKARLVVTLKGEGEVILDDLRLEKPPQYFLE